MIGAGACDACLRRTDLIARIAGYLEIEWRARSGPARVLALDDEDLLAVAAAPAVARAYARFDPPAARRRAVAAGLTVVCRHVPAYPDRLLELPDPPAVLHVLGSVKALRDPEGVAVVGARRASDYGLRVARSIGRGLSAAGVPVVSGLALGIDSAAHDGALAAGGPAVAVLAGPASVPYPARGRARHEAVAARGAVVSELPPGAEPRRWCFVARNRTIAALAAVTVVVQAAERSGSLTTADFAAELGRGVGAVPGPVDVRESAGVHTLIASGAALLTGPADVLELLADATGRVHEPAARLPLVPVPSELEEVLRAVQDGPHAMEALTLTREDARRVLAALGQLERLGLIARGASGAYEPVVGP